MQRLVRHFLLQGLHVYLSWYGIAVLLCSSSPWASCGKLHTKALELDVQRELYTLHVRLAISLQSY